MANSPIPLDSRVAKNGFCCSDREIFLAYGNNCLPLRLRMDKHQMTTSLTHVDKTFAMQQLHDFA